MSDFCSFSDHKHPKDFQVSVQVYDRSAFIHIHLRDTLHTFYSTDPESPFSVEAQKLLDELKLIMP